MEDKIDANLDDAGLAFWLYTVHRHDVLHVEGVAVRNVSGAVKTQNFNACRAVLDDTISFQGGCRFHKRAINLELSINGAGFDYVLPRVSLLFIRGWLLPGAYAKYLGTLAGEKLIVWVSCIVCMELFEKILAA